MSRIVVTGASGSGTTTLGRALATRLECPRFDADDAYWEPTDPPFTTPRAVAARDVVIRRALEGRRDWVLSGSVVGWPWPQPDRDVDLAVLLVGRVELRLARVQARELARFGTDALAPGGAMHEQHVEFLAWAGRYDTAGMEQRSRATHEAWLAACRGRVLRIEGDTATDERVVRVLAALDTVT